MVRDSLTPTSPIRFEYESTFNAPVNRLWRFYMAPGALQRLTPPLSGFRVIEPGRGVADGSIVEATVGHWPLRARWVAVHAAVRAGESFVDIAAESPFRYWAHLHRFDSEEDGRSRLTDVIWFLPPAGVPRWVGRLFAGVVLRAMFWWRHRVTRRGLRAESVSKGDAVGTLCGQTASGGAA
jgi:ligand-binding SRPBCC domain-containing protein